MFFQLRSLLLILAVGAAPIVLLQIWKWLLLPIKLHGKGALAINPEYRATELEQLSPEMQHFLGQIIQQFRAQGFVVAANVWQPDALPGMHSVQVLMRHANGDMASAIIVWGELNRAMAYSIGSRFADGFKITTGKHSHIGVFPKNRTIDALVVPWVADVLQLCELHRRRVQAAGRGDEKRIAPAAGREMEYLKELWREECEHIARCGYFYRDEAAGLYRKTWKGTYLSTWKMLEPINGWRIRLRDRAARRVWRKLGMDEQARTVLNLPFAAGESPGAFAGASGYEQTAGEAVQYETALREGELRIDRAPGAVTVHFGGPTRGQVLARQWWSLFITTVFLLNIALMIRTWRSLYRLPAFLRPGLYELRWLLLWGCITVMLAALGIIDLLRKVMRVRGTITIGASEAGLSFRNVPDGMGSGTIARGELDALVAVPITLFKPRKFMLLARRYDKRRQVLLRGATSEQIAQIRGALLGAMGMVAPTGEARPFQSFQST